MAISFDPGTLYVGTSGGDLKEGTDRDDALLGLAGNDVLFGKGGDDVIDGGSGNDTLYGGTGNNLLYGGAGDDVIYADANSNNIIVGGEGYDTAVFQGSASDYTVNGIGDNSYTVVNNTTHYSSFLQEIEAISFQSTTPLPCYVTGTMIETRRGAVAVENLRAGDEVRVVSGRQGEWAPVSWIGFRQVDLLRHPRAEAVQPVRVLAGALGNNLPVRDLVMSPDHCLLIDGLLIPVQHLVNGQTIVQERARAAVTYWHVELPQHDAILAEGVAAESYLDTGNRASFANGGAAMTMYADFAQDDGRATAERLVPRLTAADMPRVAAIRASLVPAAVALAA
ncbi:Hint domain-containing protein [Roseomonas elaeocarpi]|uniref:Hint domain-containing protein n=1 Tax=Roseomonas elaeocarpi TaxID=907779 RepID=A0ABV6JTE3_9PROT